MVCWTAVSQQRFMSDWKHGIPNQHFDTSGFSFKCACGVWFKCSSDKFLLWHRFLLQQVKKRHEGTEETTSTRFRFEKRRKSRNYSSALAHNVLEAEKAEINTCWQLNLSFLFLWYQPRMTLILRRREGNAFTHEKNRAPVLLHVTTIKLILRTHFFIWDSMNADLQVDLQKEEKINTLCGCNWLGWQKCWVELSNRTNNR